MTNSDRFKVAIAGAGVAGLEAAFALHELTAGAIDVVLLSPEKRFVYRPLAVREPFDTTPTPSYPIDELAQAAGAELVPDTFSWLDPKATTVHTRYGRRLRYDALLLAMGARRSAQLPYATTLNPAILGAQLEKLVHEVEHGLIRRVTFVVPSGHSWPLPIYELALMLSRRADQVRADVAITIVSSEREPLAVFGQNVSDAVTGLLDDGDIRFLGGSEAQIHEPHWVSRTGDSVRIFADRIVASPELCAPQLPGVPTRGAHGFVSIDRHCRVTALDGVFAAGDITDRPVKHGGLAAQQADVAAAQIAARAGGRDEAEPGVEIAHAMLLGGDGPLYIRAEMIGGVTTRSEVSHTPLWEHAEKVHARYLAPVLARTGPIDGRKADSPGAQHVQEGHRRG